MLIQEQSIHSLDLSELDLDENESKDKADVIQEADEVPSKAESFIEEEEVIETKVKDAIKQPETFTAVKEEKSFEKILDMMEIF